MLCAMHQFSTFCLKNTQNLQLLTFLQHLTNLVIFTIKSQFSVLDRNIFVFDQFKTRNQKNLEF